MSEKSFEWDVRAIYDQPNQNTSFTKSNDIPSIDLVSSDRGVCSLHFYQYQPEI